MNTEPPEWFVKVLARAINIGIDVGLVWLLAYEFKPDLPSSTVWFIALVVAVLVSPSRILND